MSKLLIYCCYFAVSLPLPLMSISAVALYNYVIKEAEGENDSNSAKLAASLFQNIDFKGNTKVEKELSNKFSSKFKKPILAYAPAQGVPSNLTASTTEIDNAIKSAKDAQGYLEAFKKIVDTSGKPAVAGLKAKGVPAADINKVIDTLKTT